MRKAVCTLAVTLLVMLFMGACGSSEPETPNTYLMRGMQRAATGDLSGAIEDFTKAIELEPENASLYVSRAIAYDMNSDYQLAIQDYERAIELKPELEVGLQEQLNHLRAKASI